MTTKSLFVRRVEEGSISSVWPALEKEHISILTPAVLDCPCGHCQRAMQSALGSEALKYLVNVGIVEMYPSSHPSTGYTLTPQWKSYDRDAVLDNLCEIEDELWPT